MAARRLLSTSLHHRRLLSFSSSSFLRHSSTAAAAISTPDLQPLPPPQPTPTLTPPPPVPAEEEQNPNPHRRSTRSRGGGGGGGGEYEGEQTRVLRASLSHVGRLGWGESAMIAGARGVGVSPSIVGSFPRKESALVEFFMDDCLQRLIDKIESGVDLQNLILSDRLSKLIHIRLEMQAPYISKWPQALSIQSQPTNLQVLSSRQNWLMRFGMQQEIMAQILIGM